MSTKSLRTDQGLPSDVHVLVAGEALIDFVSVDSDPDMYRAMPGGSPFNVAIGLARLDVPAGFLGKLSTDPFGQQLRATLQANGVTQNYVQDDNGPSTLAMITSQPGCEPQFSFYGHDAADQQLLPEDLPEHMSDSVQAIHFGSYSMACQPIGGTLTGLMQREHGHRIISFDPNVRTTLIPDLETYKAQLEGWMHLSHIVKLSQADLEILYPENQLDEIAKRWLAMGPKLVVITRGKDGATGFTKGSTVSVPSSRIQLVDSIGAGDAFMSGLLAWLYHHSRLSLDTLGPLEDTEIHSALQFASRVAALTCARQGANPPLRSQLVL